MGKRKLRFDVRKNSELKLKVKIPLHLVELSFAVSFPLSAFMLANVQNGSNLRSKLIAASEATSDVIPKDWVLAEEFTRVVHIPAESPQLLLYKPVSGNLLVPCSTGLMFSLAINSTLEWTIRVGTTEILECELFQAFPSIIGCLDQVVTILNRLDSSGFCEGNADTKFSGLVDRHKGKFMDSSGKTVVALYDTRSMPAPTIRHTSCSILVAEGSNRCQNCKVYRRSLHAMVSRITKAVEVDKCSIDSHVNKRYMDTTDLRKCITVLHNENRALKRQIERLTKKLDRMMGKDAGVSLEVSMTEDLHRVMEEEEHQALKDIKPGTFQHVFWLQQKAASGKDKRGMRWHPAMIKWCLFLRHQSSKAYETLRQSGCIHLPSQRTLRDYSQCVKTEAGFSTAVDLQLLQAANHSTCEPWQKLIILLLDEMYVRCDLVFDKHSKRLIGFTALGDVNDHLLAFEKSMGGLECSEDEIDDDEDVFGDVADAENEGHLDKLAKTMMVFMVRGLFTKLRFPYAHFPCGSISGELLYQPFWEAVRRLEKMQLKVLAATFDGASTNRRLVKIHDLKSKFVFKVKNVYSEDNRDLFFFSDPPHLMKTTRNCWSSRTRSLWNQQDIAWEHLLCLYHRDAGKASGLAMVNKLKYEHVHLSSFSKMRVDLAVQVLSESVAKALPLVVGQDAIQTAKFASIFDKFFDLLNVSNFTTGSRSRKPFLLPYQSSNDERLTWLEKTFLPYLDSWDEVVEAREGFSNAEKNRMKLSDETRLGLRMTANSFVHLVRYLFSMPEVKDRHVTFLSNNICQDPLEGFFGCQRQRGGTSDNPNVQEFYNNTSGLRAVNSFCRNSITGNCRRKNDETTPKILSQEEIAPLPKRRRLNKRKSIANKENVAQ